MRLVFNSLVVHLQKFVEQKVQKIIPIKPDRLRNSLFSFEKIADFYIDGNYHSAIVHESAIEQGNICLDVMSESADTFLVRVPGKMSGTNLLTVSRGIGEWCYRIARSANR